jgi:RES domain-containing protein
VVRGLYLACCEETAWAEWLRATAEDGVPPARRLPRDVWPLDVDVDDVADLSSQSTLQGLGLWPLRPTQDDWPECQIVGESEWRGGAAGILAPSAAHDGHQVLCIFRTDPFVPGVAEVPPPTTYDAIPVIPTGLRT